MHGLEQPAFDDDPFYDSHDALRDYSKKHSRLWMMIQRVMTNRRVSQAVVALVLLVFASTLQVAPWNERFGGEVEKTQSSFSSLMAAVTRPIQDRAAFFIVDNFQDGLDDWLNSDAMKVDPSGFVTVDNGLALRSDTLNFVSYRMDFHAKIESGAVGWVVRASNEDNYYAFKLVESKRRNGSSYHLLRYPVVDGVKSSKAAQVRIPVPANIVHDDFNRLSVRVRDQHITTLINGFGVDFWRDDTFDRGGIGFLADGQERARISRVSVTGNDDTWGLILYGTMETVRTLREKFSPRMAVVLTPVPVKALNRY